MALIVNSKLVVIHYFGTKHNPKFTWNYFATSHENGV